MLNCDKATFYSRILAIAFFASLLFAISGEAATIYIWRDDNGVKQYSDSCPTGEKCRVKNYGSTDDSGGKGQGKKGNSWQNTDTTNTDTTNTDTTSTSGGGTTDTTGTTAGSDTTTSEPTTSGDTTTTDTTDTTSTDTTSTDTASTDTASTDTGPVADGTADLEWDPVVDAGLSGYRVFYAMTGTAYQAIDVGNTTTHTFTGLDSGTRYYFRVAAYDSSGNQSAFSNEVYKDMP